MELEHRFALSPHSLITLSDFEADFLRRVTDTAGEVLPELDRDHWVVIPLRVRASDPKEFANDFSIQQLVTPPTNLQGKNLP